MAADNSFHVRVRSQLIRRDLQTRHEAWNRLKSQLEPGLRAEESEFRAASAQDVIQRNQGRSL
ncbi:transcriptional regulator [Mesorhizobium sp. MSK_1335]|uniref:Transcriptional regulator n=1 Tax=Mesorhizobium montanum TaxID=3072323 RepID=A0ABU4ZL97_9HYPH|nr:transcriptional regulator [Mesorhizobium sp. MSK_1335]MDX8525114.1 transcriptional regulator [Mesorhizobium sp. MSK_1335]